ncbi:MAG: hypothetical protein FXF49_09835 [Flexistipes sinusarabici]|uniref:Uncharacterized protein n=1 Tax=Flexistipes sinusarabici TaxID=2352 RepID=A0A5D0MNE3_FLESI|nr:hypothetical protein [Flexistipes sinusarabici]TYB32768.1 MAG: hypothetical protein FXF49_09835 [Flexistipes sinusarabici]
MTDNEDLEINLFQLNGLFTEDQKRGFRFILQKGVFCTTCKGPCEKEIQIEKTYITPMNDILVKGTCKVCGGKVARVIEFGEDKTFSEKADKFRKNIKD